jgi:hypothetical protein
MMTSTFAYVEQHLEHVVIGITPSRASWCILLNQYFSFMLLIFSPFSNALSWHDDWSKQCIASGSTSWTSSNGILIWWWDSSTPHTLHQLQMSLQMGSCLVRGPAWELRHSMQPLLLSHPGNLCSFNAHVKLDHFDVLNIVSVWTASVNFFFIQQRLQLYLWHFNPLITPNSSIAILINMDYSVI